MSRPTLIKFFQEWTNFKKEITNDTLELRLAIASLFFSAQSISDETMLRIFKQKNYTVTLRNLISIRKHFHIYRNTSLNAPQRTFKELADLINSEFSKGGILDYGRVQLITYFR
jgi:hypothetical protein